MTGVDADRLMALLERLVASCEQIVGQAAASEPASGRKTRKPYRVGKVAADNASDAEVASPDVELPPEVSTARAAEILGVSKDTVLVYREKGLLPFRDLSPPGSTKPVYMFPRDAVVALRTTYQTEEPAPAIPREPSRRQVKGKRRYKHLQLDDEA